jgi:hypothetical protein
VYIPQSSQQSIVNTASAAAVTYLVDSAPGALNTLNELAQAINDDASFSTTITNSLASKLSISSASSTYVTIADANTTISRWSKNYSASTTVITGLDDNSNILDYSVGYLTVFINGILMDSSAYTATDGINIILSEPVLNQEIVEVLSYRTFNVADTYTTSQADSRFLQQSNASSTYLTKLSASNTYLTVINASATYATKTDLDDIDLTSAIQTASAAAVSYADGLTTEDVTENINLYFTNERAVNAGSATYILQTNQQSIINSASAAAVTYLVDSAPSTLDTLNELAAALNDDPNYATTITNALASKLDSSTASTIYLTQNSASTTYATKAELAAFSSEEFLIKAEPYTAVAGDVVFVNSASGAYTVTLPASPTLGDRVRIIDLANNAATNNITAGRNGNNIDGSASNFTIDINNSGVEFIYTNATYGWRTLND